MPAKPPTQASWRQAAVAVIGAMLLILGLGCGQLSIYDVQLLAFDGYYADAELEVVKYHLRVPATGFGSPGNYRHGRGTMREAPSRIEGVIHPGGIPVTTNDRDVQLAWFDKSGGVVVDLPLPQEVEGKRIPVLYWAGDPAGRRWYHPPLVQTAVRPSAVGVVLSVLACVGLLFAAGWCFHYVYDRRRAAAHHAAERTPGQWPPWTFLAVNGCVLTYPLVWLTVLARTVGYTRTPGGRVPWGAADWAASALLIGVVSVVPLALTAALVYAVRKRLAYRSPAMKP